MNINNVEITSTPNFFSDKITWTSPQGWLHREDGPAVEWYNGNQEFWCWNKRHRINGPAIIGKDYVVWWYFGLKDESIDAVLNPNTPISQWMNKFHRDDGANVISPELTAYWKNNKLHRLDGPAVERINGVSEYWLDGIKYISQLEFLIDAELMQEQNSNVSKI